MNGEQSILLFSLHTLDRVYSLSKYQNKFESYTGTHLCVLKP